MAASVVASSLFYPLALARKLWYLIYNVGVPDSSHTTQRVFHYRHPDFQRQALAQINFDDEANFPLYMTLLISFTRIAEISLKTMRSA